MKDIYSVNHCGTIKKNPIFFNVGHCIVYASNPMLHLTCYHCLVFTLKEEIVGERGQKMVKMW
jgi:hypothetical protein